MNIETRGSILLDINILLMMMMMKRRKKKLQRLVSMLEWSGGITHPTTINCPHIPHEAIGLANIFQEFLNTTRIPIYDPKDHTGILRIVTIRLSKRMKQCMIIILHSVPVVPSLEEEEGMRYWEDEKKRLVDMLTNQPLPVPDNGLPYIPEDAAESEKPTITNQEERPTIKVTSVYFQEYTGLKS